MRITAHFSPLILLAAASFVVSSCGDATGPVVPYVLVPDVTVSGRVEAADRPVEYRLPVKAGDLFVVYFQTPQPGLSLSVIDPRNDQVLGWAADGMVGGTLTDARTPIIRAPADGRLLVRVVAGTVAQSGEFQLRVSTVRRLPETHAAQIALNDTVSSESLDSDIDVDEFTFDVAAGDEIIVFLKVGVSTPQSPVVLDLLSPDDAAILTVGADDPGADLELVSSGRVVLTSGGRHRVQVSQWGRSTRLPYSFQVRRVVRAPERAAATLASADTVANERLDYVGDIDEFVIAGTPGDAYNLFVHPLGPASNVLHAQVVGQDNTLIEVNPNETLVAAGIGAFVLPASGRATVRVSGAYDQYGMYRGPYEILAYRVDPAPEHAAASLASAVTVSERLELPGDIDRFALTLASDGVVNVAVRKPPGDGEGALQIHVRRPGESADIASAIAYYAAVDDESRASTGNVQLAAGNYVVEIDGYTGRKGGFVGGYELTSFRIDPAPEHGAAAIAIGDTVVAESVDHIGDVDVFTFSGTAGQSVYSFLTQEGMIYPEIGVEIVHPQLGALVQHPSHIVGPLPAMRVELPETGTYELRVGATDTRDARDVGAYRVGVLVASPAPETTPAAIALGAHVTAEKTDFFGDIDEFTLAGPPGEEMTATLISHSYLGAFVWMTVLDPATGAVVASTAPVELGGSYHTGRFRIPASGNLLLRAAEVPRCMARGYCFGVTGPFELWARRIDRAPERASARIAVGSTVEGEAVDFPGDVDEYAFAGTAGQRVRVLLRGGIPVYGTPELALDLVDPTTDAVLASTTANFSEGWTAIVELPASRDFMVRVRGARDSRDAAGYSFVLEAP